MTSTANSKGHVLVADDDPVTLTVMAHALRTAGYEVTRAGGGRQAEHRLLGAGGVRQFDCLVTDVQMPDLDGLDLMRTVARTADAPAVVAVSAFGDKMLMEQLLHLGVVEFLDKPIMVEALIAAVGAAVEVTSRRRLQMAVQREIASVARTTEALLCHGLDSGAELLHYPKQACGGDSVAQLEAGPGRRLTLVSDVSGHDLKAAFASAYFRGMVRGMMVASTEVTNVLDVFNRAMLGEFSCISECSSSECSSEVSVSMAATALLVDDGQSRLSVTRCGAPLPVFTLPDGKARTLSGACSHPLGWFDQVLTATETVDYQAGASVSAWTDGIEDLALGLEVSPLAVAYRLAADRRAGSRSEILSLAGDDILAVTLALGGGGMAERFHPLLVQTLEPGDAGRIDQLQDYWNKSLRLALRMVCQDRLYDVLLCLREAVLNALRHGCRGAGEASLSLSFCPATGMARAYVDDPGPGHRFDIDAQEAAFETAGAHRGLILLRRFTDKLVSRRGGASLEMEWDLCSFSLI